MKVVGTDFLIIGSGLAGSLAAYLLSRIGDVVIVSKEPPAKSNSYLAQGGIAAAVGRCDSPTFHEIDTLHAGGALCDPKAVAFLTERAPELVRWLVEIGVPFDRDLSGEFALGLEGAHSQQRILHAGGDATGRKVMEIITQNLNHVPNIKRLFHVYIFSLLQNNRNSVVGAIGQILEDPLETIQFIARRGTILATGGAGQLFMRSTNPRGATGDGIALAFKAGVRIRNMEFVQFHPTALDQTGTACFLISEAVRGAGGVLVNGDGKPIMETYPFRDLESRDLVAREIYAYVLQNEKIYLDCLNIPDFKHKFPTIYQKCLSSGINPEVDRIPVAPAAHFMMGGVVATMDGRTDLPGLYALGEVASTGVHGANRLASNSLLECLVMASSLSEHIQLETQGELDTNVDGSRVEFPGRLVPDSPERLGKLQSLMWNSAGIIRNRDRMENGIRFLKVWQQDHPQSLMYCTARLILQSALSRKESRGAHYRLDFPDADPRLDGVDTVISNKKSCVH